MSIIINQYQNCEVISAKAVHRGLSSVLYRQIIKKISDESDPLQALRLRLNIKLMDVL
ncbi:hypothetical protein RhiirB3_456025 [Rhizophagus irregularis]|nr:hypothetical protein RhiirB3_456025 [Rhizophagus irregularis]